MKAWVLLLIVGSSEHHVSAFENMEACSKAGMAILRAANEAYGNLPPNLRFHCSQKP